MGLLGLRPPPAEIQSDRALSILTIDKRTFKVPIGDIAEEWGVMSTAGPVLLTVAGRSIDVSASSLSGPDGERRLEPRLTALLACLADARGGVVARGALVERVWAGRPVGDDAIDSAICRLRQALGDRGKRLIQTVPKRGYRLVGHRRENTSEALCARGEMALSMWNSAAAAQALSCFQAVLAGTPDSTRAIAGAALARAMVCYWGASSDLLDTACVEAEAARRYAPGIAWGWLANGVASFLRTGEADAASEHLRRAFDIDPFSVLTALWRSLVHCANSEFDAAIVEAERAVELDPHAGAASTNLVQILFFARRYGQCAETAANALARFENSLGLRAYRGWALLFAGNESEAVEVMLSSWRAGVGRSERIAALANAFKLGGVRAYFTELAKVTTSEHPSDIVRPVDRAVLWAMAQDQARAVEALELAVARRDPQLRWIAVMPQFDGLRGAPEFEAILAAHAPCGG